jgi:hypothetical protein
MNWIAWAKDVFVSLLLPHQNSANRVPAGRAEPSPGNLRLQPSTHTGHHFTKSKTSAEARKMCSKAAASAMT